MPAATDYSQSNNEKWRQEAAKELSVRRAEIATSRQYYKGIMKQSLKPEGGKDPNVYLPYPREIIDYSTAFAVPAMPKIIYDGDDALTDETARLWSANKGAEMIARINKSGGKSGHVFVRVAPGDGDGSDPIVRLINSSNVVVAWDADDYERVLWYEIHWGKNDAMRQDIVPVYVDKDTIASWMIYDYQKSGNVYIRIDEREWNYPLGPLVDWQYMDTEDSYYGEMEMPADARHLVDICNGTKTDLRAIERYHAFPKTIVIGASLDRIQETGIDKMIVIEDKDAEVFNLEMKSDLISTRSDLEHTEAHLLRRCRMVFPPTGVDAFKGATNLGIQVAFMPMTTKVNDIRRGLTRGISDITRRMLMLKGMAYDMLPHIQWDNALPQDPRERVGLQQMQIAMGIMSRNQAMIENGRDPDMTAQQIREENAGRSILLDGAPVGSSG